MKTNNLILTFLSVYVLLIGCQPAENQEEYVEEPNVGEIAFEKNAATILRYLEDFQNENINYERDYAKDFAAWSTGYGELDTINYEQLIEMDKGLFEMLDFKMIGDVNLLPGVNVETKKIDGSVRLYAEWAVTMSATDSTEAKTGNFRMYHAFVFNEEGKITLTLDYGDFGGLMNYLTSEE